LQQNHSSTSSADYSASSDENKGKMSCSVNKRNPSECMGRVAANAAHQIHKQDILEDERDGGMQAALLGVPSFLIKTYDIVNVSLKRHKIL
jgi:hypothetical protein